MGNVPKQLNYYYLVYIDIYVISVYIKQEISKASL